MRFLMIPSFTSDQKPNPDAPFDEDYFMACMRFNEEMHNAGILLASEGLNPADTGGHVLVKGGKRHIVDGPYAETKELVAGFWMIEVKSRAEAMEWAARSPINPAGDEVIEVRQLTGAGDIPPEFVTLIQKAAPNWAAAFTGSVK